jgi:diguanylate cyclase (GGDEF)-like protein
LPTSWDYATWAVSLASQLEDAAGGTGGKRRGFDAMHPLLAHQLQHYMGADFAAPDRNLRNLFEAISKHYEELEYCARFDPVTGVANRRYFAEMVEAELSRSSRYGRPLSILMMDIDHFKEINDAYGHHAGDIVLQTVYETCKSVLREIDVVGRWGGDEFAILLPETRPATALKVAKRLRSAMQNAAVSLETHLPLHFSVSIGCASRTGADNDLDTILNLADKALYDAKRTGRNRVCVADQ